MRNALRTLTLTFLLVGAAVSVASGAEAQVSLEFQFGTRDRPLRGRQFETMRALAHYLDETAQDTSRSAAESLPRRSRATQRVLESLNSFARRAAAFHERMDTYESNPWDVPREVVALDRSARRVNDTLQRTPLYADVADGWNGVVDVLDRMRQLLAGQDVQVPPAHGQGRDYDRDYAPFNPGNSRSLGGDASYLGATELGQFRRLMHELDVHVSNAHELAEQSGREDQLAQELFLEIHHLNDVVSALHQRTDSGQLDRRELAPAIHHILEDSQSVNRKMRQSGVLRSVWGEWQQSLDILGQLAEAVR